MKKQNKGKLKVEIVCSNSKDHEERLFLALKHLLDENDIIFNQKFEND